jgi:hypothetical protein
VLSDLYGGIVIKQALDRPAEGIRSLTAGYNGGGEMPLGGYAAILGAYFAIFGGLLVFVRRKLPRTIQTSDVLLMGVATHKLARIVTKDWVTSPIRAPFTEYRDSVGMGEVREASRGSGLRKATGDLLTCPWCIGPWIAGGLYTTLVKAPRAARLVASVFTSVAVSDTLHLAYQALRRRASD